MCLLVFVVLCWVGGCVVLCGFGVLLVCLGGVWGVFWCCLGCGVLYGLIVCCWFVWVGFFGGCCCLGVGFGLVVVWGGWWVFLCCCGGCWFGGWGFCWWLWLGLGAGRGGCCAVGCVIWVLGLLGAAAGVVGLIRAALAVYLG
ncbi:hypothetical protein, partial [Pseudomonas syringae group genomosp. 7]|uniref:hypothetical protein n=1 Tax=Pseudomonas syringae group genomosp. 7 TaxID=251699 RepID=UPI00377021B8